MNLHPIETIYRAFPALVALCLALFLGACASPRIERKLDDIPRGDVYQPANLFAVPELPRNFRRVAVLPVYLPADSDADSEEVASVLMAELRRTGRFEIVEVSPDTLFRIVGRSRLSSQAPFPPDLLDYLQTQLMADGVFQAELTAYRPYRPFEVGIRSRLFDLDSGSPLWAVDEVFDAGSKLVSTGARHYSLGQIHEKYPYGDSYSALRSARRFTGYAAFTLFQTIPGFPAN